MRSERRRSGRPDKARGRPVPRLETLEGRQLLAQGSAGFGYYLPTDLPNRTVDNQLPTTSIYQPKSVGDRQLSFLDSEGKVLTGKDREGDEWSITVHGPGSVIVTDTTPNDGVFDDELDTIQLVGTSLTDTYVTGQVVSSARVITSGTINFSHLIAQDGVASIILNGFTLVQPQTTPPPGTTTTGPAIYLPGGVQTLQFHDINGLFDLAQATPPMNIIIGSATNPLPSSIQPTIRLDSINNTVINSALTTTPDFAPQTQPTINILINGELHGLDYVSSTAAPVQAGFQDQFPTMSITGRTAVQALGIDHLQVAGSARNTTFSKRSVPFQSGLSGLDHVGSAQFGGTADAVGIDATDGRIGRVIFSRGLGDPTGTNTTATGYGTPIASYGDPAFGLLGGLVTAKQIGSVEAGAANTILRTANDPDFIQLRTQGYTYWYPKAGNALTNAAIVSSGSIGSTTVLGNSVNSEIKSGFHYPSFVAGLEPTRAASSIGPYHQNGDLVGSVVSATYRPNSRIYGLGANVAGPGSVRGNLNGGAIHQRRRDPPGQRGRRRLRAARPGAICRRPRNRAVSTASRPSPDRTDRGGDGRKGRRPHPFYPPPTAAPASWAIPPRV